MDSHRNTKLDQSVGQILPLSERLLILSRREKHAQTVFSDREKDEQAKREREIETEKIHIILREVFSSLFKRNNMMKKKNNHNSNNNNNTDTQGKLQRAFSSSSSLSALILLRFDRILNY